MPTDHGLRVWTYPWKEHVLFAWSAKRAATVCRRRERKRENRRCVSLSVCLCLCFFVRLVVETWSYGVVPTTTGADEWSECRGGVQKQSQPWRFYFQQSGCSSSSNNSNYLTNKASKTEDRFVLLWGFVLTAVLLTLVLEKQHQLTCIACLW